MWMPENRAGSFFFKFVAGLDPIGLFVRFVVGNYELGPAGRVASGTQRPFSAQKIHLLNKIYESRVAKR
jgi:hypothetical protein